MSGGTSVDYKKEDLLSEVMALRRENVLLKTRYCGEIIKENAALQKDNEGLTADNETLLKKQDELEGTLSQLSDKISEAQNKYSMLVEENLEKESTTNEERKQLEQNLAKAENSIQDLKAQYDDITRDLKDTFNALGCEGDDVVACANDTTEKITNAEKTIGDLETNLQTTTRELNELSESCTKYCGVVQEMRTTEEALLKELEECTMAKDNRLDIIEQMDSHMVQVNSTIKEVLGCTEDGYVLTCARQAADKIKIAEREIKDMKDELQTAARNRENTEKANQALSGNIEKIEGKIRKTKEVLGCKKNDDVAECAGRMVQERNSTIERLKKTVEEKSAKVAEKSATITQLKNDAGELEEILNQMSYPKPEVENAFGCEPGESLEECARRVMRNENESEQMAEYARLLPVMWDIVTGPLLSPSTFEYSETWLGLQKLRKKFILRLENKQTVDQGSFEAEVLKAKDYIDYFKGRKWENIPIDTTQAPTNAFEPTVSAPPPPRAPRGDWGFAPRTVAAAMVPPYTSLPMTMRNNFRPVLGV